MQSQGHHSARPRCQLTFGETTNAKRSVNKIPMHPNALGVSVEVLNSIYLWAIARELGEGIVRKAGFDLPQFIESGLLRARHKHTITVAPVVRVGNVMHIKALSDKQKAKETHTSRRQKKLTELESKLRTSLHRGLALGSTVTIDGVDWYGTNGNVLAATLDPDCKGV